MSSVATLAFPAPSASEGQGIQLDALSTSGQQINESIADVLDGESVRRRVALDAQDGESQGNEVQVVNVATGAQRGNLPGGLPCDDSHRLSLSSSRTGSTLAHLTRQVTNTVEKSKTIHVLLAILSTTAIVFTIISFWPSFGQYWYSKAAWNQGVQSANQTTSWQEFNMKNAFYQSCQNNRMINNTVNDPACEEALKYPVPTLPIPYMISPLMDKLKRRLLGSMCECDCTRAAQELDSPPNGPHVSVTVSPTDAGGLDVVLVIFVVMTAVVVFLVRKRLSISRRISSIFHKSIPSASPYVFRPGIQVNGSEKVQHGQSSAITITASARRRGVTGIDSKKQNLWQAAASGNMNVVQEHLGDLVKDINQVHSRYGTPLCAACEGGDLRIATILLIRGADVNVTGGRFFVPIQAAAYAGNTTLVQFLLAKKARVDIFGGWSETPLQAACERGEEEMVRALLDTGAAVNAGGGSFGFPLQAASARGRLDISSLLIRRGADINAQGGEYGCALNAAVACGSIEIVDLLLKNEAKVDLPPGDYGNCVQIALRQGYPALAKLLIEKGANGDVADEHRRTPLIEAVILGDIELVTRLLQGDVDLNVQDEDKWSALHYVAGAREGQEEIAKLLIEKGANVKLRDKWGAPALHRAAGGGHIGIMKLLLDHGADIDAQDVLGATALHQAAAVQEEALRLLLSRGADPSIATSMGETALHSAVNGNNLSIVKALLDAGSDTSAQDNDQATALFRSVNRGFYGITRELLERGANVNARSSNVLQETIAKGEVGLVELMIEKGANVNAQGNQFGSALQAAACTNLNSTRLVTLLLDKKTNPNLGGGEYGSALAAAAYLGKYDIVRLLLESGANPNVRGGRYGSVLRTAQLSPEPAGDKNAILALLRENGARVLTGVQIHDDDVWRLTPAGWSWLPPENRKDITSAFGKAIIGPDGEVVQVKP